MKKSMRLNFLTAMMALIAMICAGVGTAQAKPAGKTVTVGILEPVEIDAFKSIVKGFQDQIHDETKDPKSPLYGMMVKYDIENAQGDITIQREILNKFNFTVDYVAVIGTTPLQMAVTLIKPGKPIIGIAPDNNKDILANAKDKNVTYDFEGIEPAEQLHFIRMVMATAKKPLHKMTFIHSADQRIFTDAQKVKHAAAHPEQAVIAGRKSNPIKLQELEVQRLSDLPAAARSIDQDSDAVFILEDELVVSGINTIIREAQQRHIPVIASDDGSVKSGAAFAAGVSQYDVGRASGKVFAQVVGHGGDAAKVKPVKIGQITVYVNAAAAKRQGIDPTIVEQAAKAAGYKLVTM